AGRVIRGGGSFSRCGSVVSVLVAAATARAGRAPLSLGAGEGDRDLAPAPPTAGAGAAGCSSSADAGRSGATGRVQPGAAAAGVAELVVCDAGDAAELAPVMVGRGCMFTTLCS